MAVSVKDAETIEKTAEKADEKKKSGSGRATGAKKAATPRARTKKTEAAATTGDTAAKAAPAKTATPAKKAAAATGARRTSAKKSDQAPAAEAAAEAQSAQAAPAKGKSASPRGRKSAAQSAQAAPAVSGAPVEPAAPAAKSPAKASAAAKSAAKGASKTTSRGRSAKAGKDAGEQGAPAAEAAQAAPEQSAPAAEAAARPEAGAAGEGQSAAKAAEAQSAAKAAQGRGRAKSGAAKSGARSSRPKAGDTAKTAAKDRADASEEPKTAPADTDRQAAAQAARPEPAEKATEVAAGVAPDTDTASGADSEAALDAGQGQARRSRSRGGRGRKRSGAANRQAGARSAAETGPEAAPDDALADFPSGFGDTGPEDIFAMEDGQDSGDEAAAEGGRKRKRTRRGGRGRRKASASGENGAQSAAAPAEIEEALDDEADDLPEESEAEAKSGGKTGRRKMFVSVLAGEQVEVVITEEGQVQEYYVEMLHQAKIKGNIYKGVVHNVDANLQAAFVNYGQVKNGFLQIDEIHPEYYVAPHEAAKGRKYPPIQKVLKPGQEVLVQVVKEPAGTKGAFLTTYLSLPGRFLVLTPGREQIGVSRKVDNESERARLRELLEGLSPGAGLGVIVRTVSMGASKTSLQRDLQFLKRTWKEVRARGLEEKAPALVYQEMDLTARAVRDYLTDAISEIWIDDEETAATVTEVAQALFPRKKNLVRIPKESGPPLFERFNVQRQLDQIQSREVSLPSGGRLVIDPTEALTAIDINSGRSGGKTNFEDMAFRTNMEAAKMIPLQLRLRDIGGQVVADFIEMRDKSHWREVEKTLRNGMKVDRARYDVGKISAFGLLEIVRQRLGSSAISISSEPCPCCNGTGVRRNMEWQSLHALRDIQRLIRNAQAQKEESVTFAAEADLALHLLNHKRQRLSEMEQSSGVQIEVVIKQAQTS